MVHLSPRGGQQDVGDEGVATRGGAFSLCTPPEPEISSVIRKFCKPSNHAAFLYTFLSVKKNQSPIEYR